MTNLTLVGRSSSHFTRTARIFALELGVQHTFRPVLDMKSLDMGNYADNPALKVPVLVDDQGALIGTENICRALVRRSSKAATTVLRGDVNDRVVANVEELTLHVMAAEVTIITAKLVGDDRPSSPKQLRSMENSLRYLDDNVDAVLAALPESRLLSFVEVALFCLVTHLPFREIMDVTPWKRLGDFCSRFGDRESARATPYRYDTA
jgi:glutathione S-transferase